VPSVPCAGCGARLHSSIRVGRYGCDRCYPAPNGSGWMAKAACRDAPDPDLFHATDILSGIDALAYCEACPVTRECDVLAVHLQARGTWAGILRGRGKGQPAIDADRAWNLLERATEP
jgi:hypothetical protein